MKGDHEMEWLGWFLFFICMLGLGFILPLWAGLIGMCALLAFVTSDN